MKFWWFKFEGWFADNSKEYPGEGVFSECLVRADNYDEAEFNLFTALADRSINLLLIEDSFAVDTNPEMMDPENPDNLDWIKWCEETELAGKPTFEAFHLYPANQVQRTSSKDN